jgi:hypothetical protein
MMMSLSVRRLSSSCPSHQTSSNWLLLVEYPTTVTSVVDVCPAIQNSITLYTVLTYPRVRGKIINQETKAVQEKTFFSQ